jgi:general secretion pathway protein L
MPRIVGIDLGASGVKCVELEGTFRGYAVRAVNLEPLAAAGTWEERTRAALQALRARGALAAELWAVAVPGARVSSHLIQLPFTDLKRVEATLPFEVEGRVPYDLDEVVWDYQVMAQEGGKSELLVGVVRKEHLRALLALLTEAGVDPRFVTFPALAYQNLFSGAVADPGGAATQAILDIGEERSNLCIVGPERAEFARTIAGGGADLVAALAREFGVPAPYEDARRLLEREASITDAAGAGPQALRASRALERALGPLLREVRASLFAHAARFRRKAARLHLCGGAAALPGLHEFVARELGVETVPFALTEAARLPAATGANGAAQADPAVFALALGVALRAQASARGARLNFRKGEFAFTRGIEQVRGRIGRIAAYAAVLVVLAGAGAVAQVRTLAAQEEALDAALCAATQKTLGKCEPDFRRAISLLRGKGSPAAGIPRASALDMFRDFVDHLPDDAELVLNEVNIPGYKLHVEGEVDSYETVDKIVQALKSHRCFGDVKTGRVQQQRGGSKFELNLEIEYTCGGAGGGS